MKFEIFVLIFFVFSVLADTELNDDEDEERSIALPKYPLPQYSENGTVQWFPRIIGGTRARIGEFPGKVSIQTVRGFHFCGGTLINQFNVLTAAHCVTDEVRGRPRPIQPGSIRVMAGDLSVSFFNPASTRQLRNVAFIFYHPNYSPITLIHDIAVLRLINPFFYSTNLHPIDLSLLTPNPGTNCFLAGWGSTEEDGPGSIELLRVNLDIISNNVCNGNQELNGLIREGMMCAGVLAGGRDACQGDSGGGLICNGVVAGVVSFGIGCGRPNLPGVYADVSFYNAWIEAVFLRSDGRSEVASIGLISFLAILIHNLK